MNVRSLQEIKMKKDNEDSHIYIMEAEKGVAKCIKGVMEAEGVSEEAANVLVGNVLYFGDGVETKASELLHGPSENEADNQYKKYIWAKAAKELLDKMPPNMDIKNYKVEYGVEEIIKDVAKKENISKEAAELLIVNALIT